MESQIERLERKIDNLHDCIDGMRDDQTAMRNDQKDLSNRMGNYFLGMHPEIHVRHHNSLTDTGENKKESRIATKETIGIIIATVIINIAGWTFINSGLEKKIIDHNNIEQIKK